MCSVDGVGRPPETATTAPAAAEALLRCCCGCVEDDATSLASFARGCLVPASGAAAVALSTICLALYKLPSGNTRCASARSCEDGMLCADVRALNDAASPRIWRGVCAARRGRAVPPRPGRRGALRYALAGGGGTALRWRWLGRGTGTGGGNAMGLRYEYALACGEGGVGPTPASNRRTTGITLPNPETLNPRDSAAAPTFLATNNNF